MHTPSGNTILYHYVVKELVRVDCELQNYVFCGRIFIFSTKYIGTYVTFYFIIDVKIIVDRCNALLLFIMQVLI